MGPYLVRRSTNEIIEFGSKLKFEIGRSQHSDLSLTAVAVSRQQCLLTYSPVDEEWNLTDLSSFKSTRVNGHQVPQCGQYLNTGDIISFANVLDGDYVFNKNEEAYLPTEAKRPRLNDDMINLGKQEQVLRLTEKLETAEEENFILRNENTMMWKELKELKEQHKKLEVEHEKTTNDSILNQVVTEELKTDLTESRIEIELLGTERNSLAAELETLKTGANLAGNDGDDILRMMVPEIVKSVEMDALQRELTLAKEELKESKKKLDEKAGKEKILAETFLTIVEQEFLCCICSEIMFQPIVMNCKHTVCLQCLEQWKKNKKECPECRTKIKAETLPLLNDRFIDRIAPLLSDEFAKKREEVKKERLEVANGPCMIMAGNQAPSRGSTGRGRRARRGRSYSAQRTRGGNASIVDLTNH